MAEETLLTAARRVVRDARICNESHGDFIDDDLTKSVDTLALQIERAERMEKQRQDATKQALVGLMQTEQGQ